MIDEEADFGDITDALVEAQGAAKFHPKVRAKPRKPSVPSKPGVPIRSVETTSEKVGALSQDNLSQGLATNQETASSTVLGSETIGDVEAPGGTLHTPSDDVLTVSAVDTISQNEDHDDDQSEVAAHQENLVVSDTQASSTHSTTETDDDLDFGGLYDTHIEEERVAKLKPKKQVKLSKAASKSRKTDQKARASAVDVVSQNKEDITNNLTGCNDQQDIDDTVDLDSQDGLINPRTDDTQPIFGESLAEATAKFLPSVGRKKRSVTFVLPDDSEVVAPTDNISEEYNDIGTDENLNSLPQQTAQKGAPSDRGVKEQPKQNVGKPDLSLKLRNRENLQKAGVSELITDDNSDEEYAEPSAAERDYDSGDEYTAGEKQKPQRKSRKKDPNKEPSTGSKRSSKNSTTEKPTQHNQQKNKSEVPSRGRKRALKDELTEQPEKKLTHRIRQKRAKVSEVQTLLEKPDHEIDRMKLSVMHLRLLQEARERIQSKTIPSGPSSSNQSSLYGDPDDFDPFGDNYVNDRTENDALDNAIKLNYHSYMNKQTRARWTKSDTDLFYQGLQQFGSDFAMIQQLFPDKSRDQVRQKFKSEEKKHPMQVHDAILHRSRDNVYLKQVIKQLNIEDLPRDINSTHKQEVASNEGDTGTENVSHVINEEENGPSLSDEELGTHQSEVKEGEHASGNVDDDDLDDFDWY